MDLYQLSTAVLDLLFDPTWIVINYRICNSFSKHSCLIQGRGLKGMTIAFLTSIDQVSRIILVYSKLQPPPPILQNR